ncbi:TetR/AcrR family transcriptional regulator [Burkholderia gladioli]|uniref:TetR/AcrR family transcriptional regulator n=1 Tax=Burkholderia gladioli TaxID=28095 RepID=UPI000CFFFFC9|nr:TetR family transcriptional regulator [Burkholderia gladioli]PRG98828.1 TetR family transcriptional regulator [Burkholderia gladioli]
MATQSRSPQRREASLSREQIIEASIEILDNAGESGLTFRALSQRLATGPGAIYWHVDNKHDLLSAACDAILAGAMAPPSRRVSPKTEIRALALSLFDTIDAHPWIGSALNRVPGQLPMVRMLERIGQQVRALEVPERALWSTVHALLSYILGVSAQNAANARIAQELDVERASFLDEIATAWSELDPETFPFTRSLVNQMRTHDDREDFLAGIDLILAGIETKRAR